MIQAENRARHPKPNPGFARLKALCRHLPFEPHDILGQLDARGHYAVELPAEFPFLIKLFHYTSRRHTRGATWHERLELFLPLDGTTRFRMGDTEVELAPGDLLVVDNFKLHHVVDFPRFNTRAIVISFLPEFVYSLGSPTLDCAFLLPFYSKSDKRPYILRPSDPAAPHVYHALGELLNCFFTNENQPLRQAGCKAHFLTLLYHLARHCSPSVVVHREFMLAQQRALRLKPLFEHIRLHFAEKLTLPDAAAMVHMSQPQFIRAFKKAAGMTLVAYLNHVRLANAARLLRQSTLSIAEAAHAVGFSDQSYFDRQFKRAFGCPPRVFRSQG